MTNNGARNNGLNNEHNNAHNASPNGAESRDTWRLARRAAPIADRRNINLSRIDQTEAV